MIDLHCHILPGIDDGAGDLSVSLEMARLHQEQGVRYVACTPHILPGVYHNSGPAIRAAMEVLQRDIHEAGLNVTLVVGADNHIVPDFVDGLRRGHLLALGDTRYVLVEPPHHVAPPRVADLFFQILLAGYVPILTHPERLSWIENKYDLMEELVERGVWLQVTSGSLTGRFGRRPKYWAERLLSDGLVHILASDSHNVDRRPPDLAEGFAAAVRAVGRDEAHNLVAVRPEGVLFNALPAALPPPCSVVARGTGRGGDHAGQAPISGTSGGVFKRVRNLFAH